MILAILVLLAALLVFDFYAHRHHVSLLAEMKAEIESLRAKIDGGSK